MGKRGLVIGVFDEISMEEILRFDQYMEKCDELIIGLYTDDFALRMTGVSAKYTFEERKKILQEFRLVSDVVAIDWMCYRKEDIYAKIPYDIVFCGEEYGIYYDNLKLFCEEKNIEVAVIKPDKMDDRSIASIKGAFERLAKEKKIVLFGTGVYFDIYMKNFGEKATPLFAIDNSKEKWGTFKDGVAVKAPEEIKKYQESELLVIVCAKNYSTMLQQLKDIGNYDYRTLLLDNWLAKFDEFEVEIAVEMEYVTRSQSLLMNILLELDRVCRELGIRYYLASGTLLGAVRHKGFIPWDDDVDVLMTRQDYELLRSRAKEIWREDDYLLVPCEDLGRNVFWDFVNRLLYMKEEGSGGVLQKLKGYGRDEIQNKETLDIYILNQTSKNKRKQKIQFYLITILFGFGMGHRPSINYNRYKDIITKLAVFILSNIGKFIPAKWIFNTFEKVANMYEKENSGLFFESGGGDIANIGFLYEKEMLGNGAEISFEGHKLMAPEHTDKFLLAHYNNYMSLPPAHYRIPSHSPATIGMFFD